MNPDQSYGAYPPQQNGNPYDFITTAPPKPPRTTRGISSGSFIGKLVFVIGGAVALMIGAYVLVTVVFGSKTNFTSIIELAQTQQEIARVANQGTQTVSDQAIAGAAMNTRLTMLTQQQSLVTYLSTHKQKVNSKQLALKKDSKTDAQFKQAQATSTFDIVFQQVLVQELTDYSGSVKTAYTNATSKELKALLATDYNQTQMLLKQWPKQ